VANCLTATVSPRRSGSDDARSAQRMRWQIGRRTQVAPGNVAAQHRADPRMQTRVHAGRRRRRAVIVGVVVARLAIHWASGMTKRTLKVRIRTATG